MSKLIPSKLAWLLAFLSLLFAAAPAWSDGYPKAPINLVIPVAAGDAADIAGRAMADELSRLLNVPVVITNKPGAGGVLGAGEVARARKDGYTILLTVNSALTFRPVLDPKTVPYDTAKDLIPLGFATRTPAVLVIRSDAPFADFASLVARAKTAPGSVRIGSAGVGSAGHIFIETVNALTGATMTMVPYTGASPAVTAVLGGFIDGAVVSLGAVTAHLKSGAMRGIVMSSPFAEFPQIPTLVRLGYPENGLGVWMAFFAPSGVPSDVTGVLVPAIEKVVKSPSLAAKLVPLGMSPEYQPPDAQIAEMRSEYRTVETVARKVKLIE
jgi:tripartite-type tricarboxylate transporter receptor subunit TctC